MLVYRRTLADLYGKWTDGDHRGDMARPRPRRRALPVRMCADGYAAAGGGGGRRGAAPVVESRVFPARVQPARGRVSKRSERMVAGGRFELCSTCAVLVPAVPASIAATR